MTRPVTLVTRQFADLPFDVVAGKAKGWGHDGMDRDVGAPAALRHLRPLFFDAPSSSFDAAFSSR